MRELVSVGGRVAGSWSSLVKALAIIVLRNDKRVTRREKETVSCRNALKQESVYFGVRSWLCGGNGPGAAFT